MTRYVFTKLPHIMALLRHADRLVTARDKRTDADVFSQLTVPTEASACCFSNIPPRKDQACRLRDDPNACGSWPPKSGNSGLTRKTSTRMCVSASKLVRRITTRLPRNIRRARVDCRFVPAVVTTQVERLALPTHRECGAEFRCLEAGDASTDPDCSHSALRSRFECDRRCNGLGRRRQDEGLSWRSSVRRRSCGEGDNLCRRRNDGRQAGVDHDPLGPFMAGVKANDGSIDVRPGRRCGLLWQAPVRQKQQREQHAAS